jgi:hypothetical protein
MEIGLGVEALSFSLGSRGGPVRSIEIGLGDDVFADAHLVLLASGLRHERLRTDTTHHEVQQPLSRGGDYVGSMHLWAGEGVLACMLWSGSGERNNKRRWITSQVPQTPSLQP